ncbi:FAD/NAD(P)-binding domain-containing protein [Calocera viscosa TUFC12733]|uniref:FAD/NAD(P)-binding domain-containing protein n=1 Tax=Calocera viscosa (strain TUFC12733) TaxID=1330018 RepID=A0A167IS87_CALVF|nr:FAD/NAD(P)-binding domain-containing protein [Calocera viscosa TUFC12733]
MALKLPFLANPMDTSILEPIEIADSWAQRFNNALGTVDGDLAQLLINHVAPWWSDRLALTWDIRTFNSVQEIRDLLQYAASCGRLSTVSLKSATLVPTATDNLIYVQATYKFETKEAINIAIVKLVPDARGNWKAWTIVTKLEDLKLHKEDRSRLLMPDVRPDKTVDALVIGGGQSGLQAAAALRTVGLSCLVVEQHERIGDHWRQHYDFLKLHVSKWYAQFAYHHWPTETPFFPTRDNVADFLEDYAKSTHLNVLTSTTVREAKYNSTGYWDVTLRGPNATSRSLWVNHLVLATGINGLRPLIPSIQGKESFHGMSMHSSVYKNGKAWARKRAVVIGCGSSGHDIAHDLHNYGASVTMIQRNPTMVTHEVLNIPMLRKLYNETLPVEVADDLQESTPIPVARLLASIPPKVLNKDVIAVNEGLVKAGFQLKTSDRSRIIFERFGGHYLNSGTSNLIVDGKIRIKSGIPIKSFTPSGLEFEDGTEMPADLIVFATGFDIHSMRNTAIELIGSEEGRSLKKVWGLDDEGNVRGAYRNSGHPNLWYFGGDFQGARYFSKILALQILAAKLGVLNRYQGGK